MSFRKRNVVIGTPAGSSVQRHPKQTAIGTRPSPFDGRPTTSTGTASLDQLLAGHSGLPLGHSILIEESSTTDFGGILLRYYAAEGLVQGHQVHVLGVDDSWRRELPGLDLNRSKAEEKKGSAANEEKMKIAWRYETLGNRPTPAREPTAAGSASSGTSIFCHTFNLAKRLENSTVQGQMFTFPTGLLGTQVPGMPASPLKRFLKDVSARVINSDPAAVHRIVIPSLLSPTLYPSSACQPQEVLHFLHGLRALLRRYPSQLTAMVTLPISLYPRATGLVRWAELLSDGVLELIPLAHKLQVSPDSKENDKTQGMLRAHSLPIFHEKGGGLEDSWNREELSFKLSSTNGLVITPFSLPPVGDEEQQPQTKPAEAKKESLDF